MPNSDNLTQEDIIKLTANRQRVWIRKCEICKTKQAMRKNQRVCSTIINPSCRNKLASLSMKGRIDPEKLQRAIDESRRVRKLKLEERVKNCKSMIEAYKLGYYNGYRVKLKEERKIQVDSEMQSKRESILK